MVNIDECLVEKLYCESSCYNFLNKNNVPAPVYTNTTSFVGIRAVIDPLCLCAPPPKMTCYNDGSPKADGYFVAFTLLSMLLLDNFMSKQYLIICLLSVLVVCAHPDLKDHSVKVSALVSTVKVMPCTHLFSLVKNLACLWKFKPLLITVFCFTLDPAASNLLHYLYKVIVY